MHAARLASSPRLQRVYKLLLDGVERSTLDIATSARVCAVNSVIAEPRANGCEIDCRMIRNPANREPIWMYRMTAPYPEAEAT